MEVFTKLDSENTAPISARKKLADISNVPRNRIQDEKLKVSSSTNKEYIEQLQKENIAIKKMLEAKDKLIELTGNELQQMRVNLQKMQQQTGNELQQLRVNLQKMQQQNLQLAQSNSQIMTELDSYKDRIKVYKHEIGCINGLRKAKMLEEEEKLKAKACQILKNEVKPTKNNDLGKLTIEGRDVDKQSRNKRRPHSESVGPSGQAQANDKAGNKRACLRRRQSARFKSEELESREDSFDIDDTKCSGPPPATVSVLEESSTSVSVVVKDEDKEANVATTHEPQKSGRTSIGRPSRHAAMKVQSYKEIPLKMKMRRPE